MLTGPGATIGNARRLRREMSLPEMLLWQELRKQPGGFRFRRQYPAGPYVLDFACLRSKLAIEIDGEAHGSAEASRHDEARDEWLANQGFRTMRITARDVLGNLAGAMQQVVQSCAAADAVRGRPAQPLHQPAAGPPPRAGEDFE